MLDKSPGIARILAHARQAVGITVNEPGHKSGDIDLAGQKSLMFCRESCPDIRHLQQLPDLEPRFGGQRGKRKEHAFFLRLQAVAHAQAVEQHRRRAQHRRLRGHGDALADIKVCEGEGMMDPLRGQRKKPGVKGIRQRRLRSDEKAPAAGDQTDQLQPLRFAHMRQAYIMRGLPGHKTHQDKRLIHGQSQLFTDRRIGLKAARMKIGQLVVAGVAKVISPQIAAIGKRRDFGLQQRQGEGVDQHARFGINKGEMGDAQQGADPAAVQRRRTHRHGGPEASGHTVEAEERGGQV